MRYEDALAASVQELRAGATPTLVLARYPEHAARLRLDLQVTRALEDAARGIPSSPGARERASASLQTALIAERQTRANSTLAGGTRRGFVLPKFAGAFAVIAVLLGLGLLAAGPAGLSSGGAAEASFDGVVIENSGSVIQVETAAGTERVSPGDVGGTGLDVGEVVSVRGRRAPDGTVTASHLDLVVQDFGAWCDQRPDACLQLKPRLEAQVEACRQAAPACQALTQRLRQLQAAISTQAERLGAAEAACQSGEARACNELRLLCARQGVLCTLARGPAAGGSAAQRLLRSRYDTLRERCAGDQAQCMALRRFCAQEQAFCVAVKDQIDGLRQPVRR